MDIEKNLIVKTSATHEDIVMCSVLALIKGLNLIVKKLNNERKNNTQISDQNNGFNDNRKNL